MDLIVDPSDPNQVSNRAAFGVALVLHHAYLPAHN